MLTSATPDTLPDIAAALTDVRARITGACRKAGRAPEDVTLVAVSKTHPAEAVAAAIAQGQLVFGENRVQEAAAKFPELRQANPALRLHIIGGLQTNKAEEAVRVADMIETLDRPKLAEALARASDKAGHLPELLVQVNIGDEAQKSGMCRKPTRMPSSRTVHETLRTQTARTDVHPAGRRRPGALLSGARNAMAKVTRAADRVDGHVGRFRDGDRTWRHPRAGWVGHIRAPPSPRNLREVEDVALHTGLAFLAHSPH